MGIKRVLHPEYVSTYPTQIWENSDNYWRLEWFRVSQIRVIICDILISFMTKMMCCCFLNVAKSFNSYANNSIFGNRIKVPGYNNKIKIHPWYKFLINPLTIPLIAVELCKFIPFDDNSNQPFEQHFSTAPSQPSHSPPKVHCSRHMWDF